jgi:polygalacturonase
MEGGKQPQGGHLNMYDYNVKQFGAAGDGVTLDQHALQQAIDTCAEAGGGTIYFPKGNYVTGTLFLRSHVHLHLGMQAVIRASSDMMLYPPIGHEAYSDPPRRTYILMLADGVTNCKITGEGEINGGGTENLWFPENRLVPKRIGTLLFTGCSNIQVNDITIRHSDCWTLHVQKSEEVMISNVTIRNNRNRINTDGIGIDGSRNVLISNCNIESGDDSIVFKSIDGETCENVTVSNCILSSRCQAIKFGTESEGPIRNITITNCVVHHSTIGLSLYLKDGGPYENIIFSNLIIHASFKFPFLVDITPRYYKTSKPISIRNITFDNIVLTGPGRIYMEGTSEHPIENVTFNNFTCNITGGDEDFSMATKATGTSRCDVNPNAVNYASQPYQFIAAHVKGLYVSGMTFRNEKNTEALNDRGLFYFDYIDGGYVEKVNGVPLNTDVKPINQLHCQNFRVE